MNDVNYAERIEQNAKDASTQAHHENIWNKKLLETWKNVTREKVNQLKLATHSAQSTTNHYEY